MSDEKRAQGGRKWSQWFHDLRQDTRQAARSLMRTPAFTAIGILTIALGVGATSAVYSVASAFLIRGLAAPDSDRIINITEHRSGNVSTGPEGLKIPVDRYEAYRAGSKNVFVDVAAHQYRRVSLSWKNAAEPQAAAVTSNNYFDVLGVQPVLGRFYSSAVEPAVVISHGLWQKRFGGSRDVIGASVLVEGAPATVIGVAPAGFDGTTLPFMQDMWMQHASYRFGSDAGSSDRWVGLFGRLREGATVERAAAVINGLAKSIPPGDSYTKVSGASVHVLTGVSGEMRDGFQMFVAMLLGTAVLVLVIAAANLAGMQLTRGAARKREIAVQLALGANRSRLIRQLLTESIVLFVLGGAAGILVAFLATRGLLAIVPPITFALQFDIAPDGGVMLFALGVAALTGTIFGLAPAFASTKPDLVSSLKDGAPSGGTRSSRGRAIFVVGQITIAVVLLVIAGLFVRGLRQAIKVDLAFDPRDVVVGEVGLAAHGYSGEESEQILRRVVSQLQAMPDVQAVSIARRAFLAGDNSSSDVSVGEGEARRWTNAGLNSADPAFFDLLRMKFVAGRNFNSSDRIGAPRVVIVNDTLAARLFPHQSAVGKSVRQGGDDYLIVGVVRTGKYGFVTEKPQAYMFYAVSQGFPSPAMLHVRTTAPADEMIQRMRREVNAIDPAVAMDRATSMDRLVTMMLFAQRFAAWLIGVFGMLGLLLASLGVYGVLSFQVSQRRREFGIRAALGASQRGVLGGVLRVGGKIALIGAVLGLALAAAATRVVQSFIFGVSPLDPITFVAVPLILCGVALLASYIPARRATRVPPTEALRAQ